MQRYTLYAIISPINEVVYINRLFCWSFFKNDKLIEKYDNLFKEDNTYKVNNNLKLIKKDKSYILERITDEYKLLFDFNKELCTIDLLNENLYTEIKLLDLEIVDKDDNITIIYKLDKEETNKLIISLKE